MRLLNLKNINNWSEKKLIAECIKKNEQAQKHLFELYSDQMYAVCLRYFNHEEAFDILNVAFVKVFYKISQFKGETKLKWWIRRVVVNTALDELRKNKKHKKIFVKVEEVTSLKVREGEDDISEFWEAALEIPKEQLMVEINKLPEATKIVFNLYALEQFSHKQIAQELDISQATSRWHLANARKTLKERVVKMVNGEIVNEQRRKKY